MEIYTGYPSSRFESRNGPFAKKHKGLLNSKGMVQRVCWPALLHEPELLFLDEPTSALGSNTYAVYRSLRKLNEQGTTIFWQPTICMKQKRCAAGYVIK